MNSKKRISTKEKSYPIPPPNSEHGFLRPDPVIYNGKVIEDDVDIPFDLKSEPVNFFV